MSRAARSIYVFGIYLIVLGAVLIATPNTLLTLLRLPTTTEPWIHVLGVPILAMGLIHLASARAEQLAFFRATVHARVFAFAALAVLALMSIAPPIVAGFGVADLAGAIWTFMTLREAGVRAPAV
jgi:hypothetical protein